MDYKLYETQYEPAYSVIVYKHSFEDENYYLETREIEKTEKGYQMMAAKPFRMKDLEKIATSVSKEIRCMNYFEGAIPEKCLHVSFTPANRSIIWYTQPGIRKLFYSEGIGIETGNYPVPGLVFCLREDKLKVFAYLGDQNYRATMDTKLYNAPFYNVSTQGLVCMGTAFVATPKDKAVSFEWLMSANEAAFFGSYFSHSWGEGNCSVPLPEFWNKLKDKKEFNYKPLKNFQITVKDLIK